MKSLKRLLSLAVAALTMCASGLLPVSVKADDTPTPGYTVSENTAYPESDAPYQVTFTYQASSESVKSVSLIGNWNFYTEDQIEDYVKLIDGDTTVSVPSTDPYGYKTGMINTGYALDPMAYASIPMENLGGGYFRATVPLPGSEYFYGYMEDESGAILKDPTNLPIANGDSDSGWSLLYVGDEGNCMKGQEKIYPRTDGQTGTVEFRDYQASDGTTQPMGVYLPYGYDPSTTYKTLYLCHGGGGNEVEWFYIGSAKNIFDNLIAEGSLEPTIIVTMDNQASPFSFEKGESLKNIVENIIPFVEEKYSVSKDPEDRALAGLSSGASVTVQGLLQSQDTFKYYGVFSPSRTLDFVNETLTDEAKEAFSHAQQYYVSVGVFDSKVRRDVNVQVADELEKAGANVVFTWENGAHDWGVWRSQLTDFAGNYLWNTPEPGVVVSKNTDYPESEAPYQATFTYKASSANVKSVSLIGNWSFYTEDQIEDYVKLIDGDTTVSVPSTDPYGYKTGMINTGYALDPMAYASIPMENLGGGYFRATVPLPGSEYFYGYMEDESGAILKDPTNLPIANGDSDSGWSLLYVGDEGNCMKGQEKIYPRTDGQTGTVEFRDYQASDGTTQPMGVYLPYGYDPSTTYKTLYLCHGGGGNEVEWFYIGSAKNIFDNLIAEGSLEPTIIVTMDNQASPFSFEKGESLKNIVENIIPFVEEKYSVSKDPEDRALAGLSSGASVTVQGLLQSQDTFKYYGVFSPSRTLDFVNETLTDEAKEAFSHAQQYYVSVGVFDSKVRRDVNVQVADELEKAGANVVFTWENGAHDWGVWRSQLTDFAENYLWVKNMVEYSVIKIENGQHVIKSGKDAIFTADGPLALMTGVSVDDAELTSIQYKASADAARARDVESGNTVITLTSEYLDTLSVGKHTLKITYTNGEASAEFIVEAAKEQAKPAATEKPKEQTPPTGVQSDSAPHILWGLAALVAVVGIVVVKKRIC